MRDCKITILFTAILLTFLTGSMLHGQTPAQSGKKEPAEKKSTLEMIPADCLGCARINNLNYVLSQADKFTQGLAPTPAGIKQMAVSGIGNMFGNPNTAGINLRGDFSCFLEANDNNTPPSFFIFVPVTDYQQFIASSANLTAADANGISNFNTGGKNAVIKQLESFTVFTNSANYQNLLKFTGNPGQSLAQNLPSDELEKARRKNLWIYGNVKKINEKYGEFILQQFEEAQQTFEDVQKQGMTENFSMQSQDAVMNFYSGLLKVILNETEYFSKTLDIKPNVLLLKGTLAAKENTAMAKMFTRNKPVTANPLLGYLENGTVFNFAFNIDNKLLSASQLKSMSLMGFDPNQATSQELEKFMEESLDVLGQWGAYSCKLKTNQIPPFSIKYIIELDNPNDFDEIADKGVALWKDANLFEFMKQFGFKMDYSIRKNTGSYKGVSIDSAKLTLQPVAPNSPDAMLINQMYGGGFNYRWGVVDDELFVCGIGAEPNKVIHELIDQVKAGEGETIKTETRQAMSILGGNPARADFMGTFNYLRALEFAFSFMPVPVKPDSQVGSLLGQSSSNIAFSGTAENNKLTARIGIPKKHIQEIVSAFMMLQQQQMQQQMQQKMQPPKPGDTNHPNRGTITPMPAKPEPPSEMKNPDK